MKKTIFILSFISFIIGCKSKSLPLINTENVYRSEFKTEDYWYYLKFHKDSTVISVSSSGEPKDVKKWFNKDLELVSSGKYTIKNDSIFFSTTSFTGTVNFKGLISAKKIYMYSRSDINGYEDYKIFKLQP